MPTSRRTILQRLLLLLFVSLVLVPLGAEVVLRLFWTGFYQDGPRGNVVFHRTRGWANAPGATVSFGKPEFHFVAHHNSLGLRGPEVPPKPVGGRARVLALGDSMTYGLGVEDDETFESVMERLDPRLEVLNAGVPAYSTVEETLLLREVGLELDPQLVLLMFLPNDLRGALKEAYTRVRVENGAAVFDPPPVAQLDAPTLREKKVRHPTLSRSYLYRFVSDRLKILRYAVRDSLSPVGGTGGLEPGEREPAWQLVFALLREVERLTRERNVKLLLVSIPEPLQVEPEMRMVGIDRQFDSGTRLRAFAEAEGIPFLDLLPGLEAAHREGAVLHHRHDGHWNATGHRVAGELIAAEVARQLALPPSAGTRSADGSSK